MTNINYSSEDNVDDWVKSQLNALGLKRNRDYLSKTEITHKNTKLAKALRGASKTGNGNGYPDFAMTMTVDNGTVVPIVFESKKGRKFHEAKTGNQLKSDQKSIQSFAVNGAVYYAQKIIESKEYKNTGVVAIGISGDNDNNVGIDVYYVFNAGNVAPKHMKDYEGFGFLKDDNSFEGFIKDAQLTGKEKQTILVEQQIDLKKHADKLNVLMNNHNITVDQRVVYISGILLACQDGDNGHKGLTPESLGSGIGGGNEIVAKIENFLKGRNVPEVKRKLMLGQFREVIALDEDRDLVVEVDKVAAPFVKTINQVSVNYQIFCYVYENIYKAIDLNDSALDVMGEMYSVFLKYALGDGKDIGIVLTPPYVTDMMVKILGVNKDSRVMDLATGSAGFLIAAMSTMIEDSKGNDEKIKEIKEKQLLGVELNAKMFALAATNMILRGDGSAKIEKGNSFDDSLIKAYEDFGADTLLLNPPFSYKENGMPFLKNGLDHMKTGGKAAIIIQDSAGSGRAIQTNKEILKKHRLIASIKMPGDLFMPSAGVQTSIYIFEAGKPHNYSKDLVKFIDFRNDGYKRTKRAVRSIDNPSARYEDIQIIYKNMKNAHKDTDFHADLWDVDSVCIEDFITDSGADWNFEQHQVIDTTPTEEDFLRTVGDFLTWKVSTALKETTIKEN